MARDAYVGSDQASTVLLTNIQGDLTELFVTLDEVVAAREGEDTLLLNLTSIRDDIDSITVLAETGLPDQTSNAGKFLQTDGSVTSWAAFDADAALPDQTDNENKVLTTDGSTASWGSPLPDQADNANKVLRTDGTDASWDDETEELPDQSGNSGKVLTTNGTVVSWSDTSLGGCLITSSALDVTLTASSVKSQLISMTADSRKVALPDSSGLDEGGSWFWIANEGAYNFSVTDNSGTDITTLMPGNLGVVFLADESADDWRVYKMVADDGTDTFTIGDQQTFISSSITYLSALSDPVNDVVVIGYAIGDGTFLQTLERTSVNTSNSIYASAVPLARLATHGDEDILFASTTIGTGLVYSLETDGTIADVGTGTVLTAIENVFVGTSSTVNPLYDSCKLNADYIVMAAKNSGTSDVYLSIGTYDGADGDWDSLSASPTELTVADSVNTLTYWSDDYILVSYQDSSVHKLLVSYRSSTAMNIAGTKVTAGFTESSEYIRLTDTKILVLYYSSGMKARILSRTTSTATTVTVNAEQSLSVINPDHFSIVRINNDTAGFVYNVNGSLYVSTLAITGNTVEMVDNVTEIYNGDVSHLETVMYDADEFFVIYTDADEGDYGKYNVITIS